MNVNLGDFTITSLDTISIYDVVTGDFRYTLDELQNATIAQTEEKVDITGKQGRKLSSLKRNKAVTISGANGLVSGGLLESQTGSRFVEKDTEVLWRDYLFVSANASATNYIAVGTTGNEIKSVFIKNTNNTLGKKLTQDATAGEDTFAYDPATKALTFADGAIADGTEIVVEYMRRIHAPVLENMSDTYSEKVMMYVDATGEDVCGGIYHIQFFIPKADFSGNFDLTMGDSQTVHNFEAEALSGACGTSGMYWSYTVFGADAADVPAA